MAVIDPWIDAELRNWARWCWSGAWPHPLPQNHAASAEGHYLAPSDLGESPEPRQPAPNRHRAEIVHRVYLELLTQRERWSLVYRYVKPTEDRVVVRRLRITARDLEIARLDAGKRVAEALRAIRS